MSEPDLDERDRRSLRGDDGPARRLAMEMVIDTADYDAIVSGSHVSIRADGSFSIS